MPLWRELSVRTHGGKISFAEAKFFQMAEFLNVPEEHTFRRQLEESFVSKTDLRPEACFWLDETSPETCDDVIAAAGGLDFAVLGIGNNAHIGLNEQQRRSAAEVLERLRRLLDSYQDKLSGL